MNCLKICFWNANGLSQHKEELEHFLRDKQIDVMLVSETHLTQRSLFSLRGYTLYDTKDRETEHVVAQLFLLNPD